MMHKLFNYRFIFVKFETLKSNFMKITIKNSLNKYLPYNEIREVSKNFKFDEDKYSAIGKVKKQTSGRCLYAEVKIELEKSEFPSSISWEANESEIPCEYLDTIITTYKSIFDLSNLAVNLKVNGGSFHVVDSNMKSFEIATFKAIAEILNFDHEKLKVYKVFI